MNYRVRRATFEDLGPLTELWQSMRFPAEDLAKRITEFQVAESEDGKVAGAVGLQICEKQGLIHSEGFRDFAVADRVRPMLWDRINALANNHGLLRLWTAEQAPFWHQCGMVQPDAETQQKLPVAFRGISGQWHTIKLREDLEALVSADKEFAVFMESERARTQQAMRQAKVLKVVATLVALGLFALVVVGILFLLKNNPRLLGR